MSRASTSTMPRHLLCAAAATGLFAASAFAQGWPNVIYHEQKARAAKAMPANRARVEAEMKAAIAYGMESPRPDTEEFLRKIQQRYAI